MLTTDYTDSTDGEGIDSVTIGCACQNIKSIQAL